LAMTMASRKRLYLDAAIASRKILYSPAVISLSRWWRSRVGEPSIEPEWARSSELAAMNSKFRFASSDELRLGYDVLSNSAATNVSWRVFASDTDTYQIPPQWTWLGSLEGNVTSTSLPNALEDVPTTREGLNDRENYLPANDESACGEGRPK